MKKQILTALILFLMFFIFIFLIKKEEKLSPYKILKVVEADTFYIDINNNNKIEEDELFKLKNVIAFAPLKNDKTQKHADKLNIKIEDYLKVGYLARSWAKEELTNKEVLVDKNKLDKYIKIKYDGNDLAETLLSYGLAFVYEKTDDTSYIQKQNLKQIKNNIKELSKVEFLLKNLNSNKIHSLTCEHFNSIHNGELILSNQKEFLNLELCKKCLLNKPFKTFEEDKIVFPKSKKSYPKSIHKTFSNVEIFLINPLEYKKPNLVCTTDVCRKILNEINNSKTSIDIALYSIESQKEIITALNNARKRGVKIRVVADKSPKQEEYYPKMAEFLSDFDAKTDDNKTLMHNKFMIFDNQKVLTGSANFSSTGIGGYNANNVVFINSFEISKIYLEEFNQMYNLKFSSKKNKITSKPSDKNILIYFSPKGNSLFEGVLPYIKNAKNKIYISAFCLTNRTLINELIEAKKRGVEILIILDSLMAQNFIDRVVLLRSSGIYVKAENWGGKNHEKTIMIDDEIFITGSTNFSASGFDKNDENMIIFKNPEIAKFYGDYFLYLFNSIPNKYLKFIPRAESLDSINSCYDGIDNNFDGKIDLDDDGCKIKK